MRKEGTMIEFDATPLEEILRGDIWPIAGTRVPSRTAIQDVTLVDLDGPDADCAVAAAEELRQGGFITVYFEDLAHNVMVFDLEMRDFETASAMMDQFGYGAGEEVPRDVLYRDTLIAACFGRRAFALAT
jgi:hypothetical protein